MNPSALSQLNGRWPQDIASYKSGTNALNRIAANLKINQEHSEAIARFATENDFTYQQRVTEPPVRTRNYAPAWLRPSIPLDKPVYVHEVSGSLSGYPVRMFLEYASASVGYEHDMKHELTKRSIVKITLPKLFPQLVLDSNKNDGAPTSTIPNSIKSDQALSLEGNFSDHFDLFVPRGLQIDALHILAPNFMQILKDSSAKFDVEFYGTEMVLVTRESIYTPEAMAYLAEAIQVELNYLSRLLKSWDYRPLKQPFDKLEYSSLNGDVVKIGPLRLKPGVLILLISIGFVLFGFLIISLNSSG